MRLNILRFHFSIICLHQPSQHTRDVDPMLVYDTGPTLAQHWVNVSCLLGDTENASRDVSTASVVEECENNVDTLVSTLSRRGRHELNRLVTLRKWNECGFRPSLCKLGQENLLRMVRWIRWHCPPDTEFKIRALAVWGRARYFLGHGASLQYWIFTSERRRNMLFLWNLNDRAGFETAISDFASRQL